MLIVVKGKEVAIDGAALSYEDVVALAGFGRHRTPSVTWKRPSGLGGTLCTGQYVTPEDGMVFNVAFTGAG